MSIAIKAENVSKLYRLGQVGTGSMQADLKRFWYKVRGKEDPFWSIGESNDRSAKGNSDYVWSLKDINFEIEQGDTVGIIGRNGAGKSTLLKLLSRVTAPTTGTIKARGRIASLLEVGTGFHPELTGRENIFINGAFLGMRKHEIKKYFDAIVDFSGVERYIDTPVKRYSSGMYVRLAFAVAAHLQSEILIVDEVLAVGDAEFQKKCLGKMGDVSKGEGRTVLFVSHNMGAVATLCKKGLILRNGYAGELTTAGAAIHEYLNDNDEVRTSQWQGEDGDQTLHLTKMDVASPADSNHFTTDTVLYITLEITVHEAVNDLVISLFLESSRGYLLAVTTQYDLTDNRLPTSFTPGDYKFRATIPPHTLAQGDYKITPNIGIHNIKQITSDKPAIHLSLENIRGIGLLYLTGEGMQDIFRPNWIWEIV